MSLQKPYMVTKVVPMFLHALEHPKMRLEITIAGKQNFDATAPTCSSHGKTDPRMTLNHRRSQEHQMALNCDPSRAGQL